MSCCWSSLRRRRHAGRLLLLVRWLSSLSWGPGSRVGGGKTVTFAHRTPFQRSALKDFPFLSSLSTGTSWFLRPVRFHPRVLYSRAQVIAAITKGLRPAAFFALHRDPTPLGSSSPLHHAVCWPSWLTGLVCSEPTGRTALLSLPRSWDPIPRSDKPLDTGFAPISAPATRTEHLYREGAGSLSRMERVPEHSLADRAPKRNGTANRVPPPEFAAISRFFSVTPPGVNAHRWHPTDTRGALEKSLRCPSLFSTLYSPPPRLPSQSLLRWPRPTGRSPSWYA